jgi:hypothetical protein
MAAEMGLSQSSVSRIWRAFGLKPHLVETWKLSIDPEFIAKVRGVVGLYMSPPEHALVLAVDEKSQIQALDRTAPCLPMLPTAPERRTHDYVRNGDSGDDQARLRHPNTLPASPSLCPATRHSYVLKPDNSHRKAHAMEPARPGPSFGRCGRAGSRAFLPERHPSAMGSQGGQLKWKVMTCAAVMVDFCRR